jgi:hypothetical protein
MRFVSAGTGESCMYNADTDTCITYHETHLYTAILPLTGVLLTAHAVCAFSLSLSRSLSERPVQPQTEASTCSATARSLLSLRAG